LCFDQGRAWDFDRLVSLCEGDADRPLVRLLLAPLPHGCFMLRKHSWGQVESGWSPIDDEERQPRQRLNDFSAFREGMEVWDFFRAAPDAASEWQRRLFAAQANYFRYLVARWGASRALGAWVLADEVDGIGEELGLLATRTGWWAHPEGEAWLGHVVRWFRGELPPLTGADCLGDPYRHPLHVAATSYGGQAEAGGNLEWTGGPRDRRPDLMGWHWYPYWPPADDPVEVWDYVVRGIGRYTEVAHQRLAGGPVLITEFGVPDRIGPEAAPSMLYPSLYHFGIWASLLAGHAGTVMDWDDGKEFGELRWRAGEGAFARDRYPVDNAERLVALRRFLGDLAPDDLVPCGDPAATVRVTAPPGGHAFALHRRDRTMVVGWCLIPTGPCRLQVTGLPPERYRLDWVDPWTGEAVTETEVDVTAGDWVLDGEEVLVRLRAAAEPFPAESRLARGHDLAFRLLRTGD
jgi:hypothetical protein